MTNDLNASLLNLLHIADPTLPIGGFSHSNGLETYVQQGIVTDRESADNYVRSMLINNYKYNDALFLRFAHQAASASDLEELLALDLEVQAFKAPFEVREASLKLGIRLLKIYINLIDSDLLSKFYQEVIQKKTQGHYCMVYGLITAILNIDVKQSLISFYYNAAVSMVTNAVKLIPLGQTDGQKILYGIHELISELAMETMDTPRVLLGVCNPGFDIKCMQHEKLYSRLYMS